MPALPMPYELPMTSIITLVAALQRMAGLDNAESCLSFYLCKALCEPMDLRNYYAMIKAK